MYRLAYEAFNEFANSKDPLYRDQELIFDESTRKEVRAPDGMLLVSSVIGVPVMQPNVAERSRHIMYYLVDRYIDGLEISIDDKDEVTLLTETDDPTIEVRLIRHLLNEWHDFSHVKMIRELDLLTGVFDD